MCQVECRLDFHPHFLPQHCVLVHEQFCQQHMVAHIKYLVSITYHHAIKGDGYQQSSMDSFKEVESSIFPGRMLYNWWNNWDENKES